MVKSDAWIKSMGENIISPFTPAKITQGISFGLSSYGYDFTLAEEFKIFCGNSPISPRKVRQQDFKDYSGKTCRLEPGSFVLGRSLEYFRIPRNILGVCFGKSTYARCGIIINVTPLEPEWEGFITIQIANLAPVEAEVYAEEGIGQIIFLEADELCMRSYKDLAGKYQQAREIQLPR